MSHQIKELVLWLCTKQRAELPASKGGGTKSRLARLFSQPASVQVSLAGSQPLALLHREPFRFLSFALVSSHPLLAPS